MEKVFREWLYRIYTPKTPILAKIPLISVKQEEKGLISHKIKTTQQKLKMKKQQIKSPSIKEDYLSVISQNGLFSHDTTQELKGLFLGVRGYMFVNVSVRNCYIKRSLY